VDGASISYICNTLCVSIDPGGRACVPGASGAGSGGEGPEDGSERTLCCIPH
jgi:hypothetical protein